MIATLLVVGLITGLQCVQSAVVGEMKDVAAAIGSLNQSYCFTGKNGCWSWGCGVTSWTSGSCFVDCVDEFHEPIDFGCAILDPGLPLAPPTSYPAPVIEPPHCCLPPIEAAPHPAACPPTGEPAFDSPGNATNQLGDCPPGDCPLPVPCPTAADCNGPAPNCPVIW